MTRKLYLEDSHLTECSSIVKSCEKKNDYYDVILDQTIIFDNAGGQPCDTGFIGDVEIIGCDEENGEFLHHIKSPLTVNKSYNVKLNWERRFDYMQQHTSEHIFSYAANELFQTNNVGFHLSDEYTTVDFDKPLNESQIEQIENLTNQYIFRNLKVTSQMFDTLEDLKKSKVILRKQSEGIREPIRIVSIEDADSCTCCAPHCYTTGETGLLLVKDFMAYKGGTRITILAGSRALKYSQDMRSVHMKLGKAFSTSYDMVPDAVSKLQSDRNYLKKELHDMSEKLNGFVAKDLQMASETINDNHFICTAVESMSADRIRSLAQNTLQKDKSVSVLFTQNADTISYILMSTKDVPYDMGEFCQVINAATGGKGGGRGQMAQGSSTQKIAIQEIIPQIAKCLKASIQNS